MSAAHAVTVNSEPVPSQFRNEWCYDDAKNNGTYKPGKCKDGDGGFRIDRYGYVALETDCLVTKVQYVDEKKARVKALCRDGDDSHHPSVSDAMLSLDEDGNLSMDEAKGPWVDKYCLHKTYETNPASFVWQKCPGPKPQRIE
jgi:hypothetical protein